MKYNPHDYTPYAVTVDVVPFYVDSEGIYVLTHERPEEPYRGKQALVGGFIKETETSHETAIRILKEKADIQTNIHIEQLETFTSPTRDPRMRIVSIAYLAVVNKKYETTGTWTKIADTNSVFIPELGFDHKEIVETALERLQAKAEYTSIATKFLAKEFTLTELRFIYQTLWRVTLDAANFQRKMLSVGNMVEETGNRKTSSGRPAKLYTAPKKIITINVPFQRT